MRLLAPGLLAALVASCTWTPAEQVFTSTLRASPQLSARPDAVQVTHTAHGHLLLGAGRADGALQVWRVAIEDDGSASVDKAAVIGAGTGLRLTAYPGGAIASWVTADGRFAGARLDARGEAHGETFLPLQATGVEQAAIAAWPSGHLILFWEATGTLYATAASSWAALVTSAAIEGVALGPAGEWDSAHGGDGAAWIIRDNNGALSSRRVDRALTDAPWLPLAPGAGPWRALPSEAGVLLAGADTAFACHDERCDPTPGAWATSVVQVQGDEVLIGTHPISLPNGAPLLAAHTWRTQSPPRARHVLLWYDDEERTITGTLVY